MNLLITLADRLERDTLNGKQARYRVRWAPDDVRFGTIAKVKDKTIWIGCAVLHHDDLVALREVE